MRTDLAKQVWSISLPPAQREVLRVLCYYANDKNQTYPSVERIAWYTDLSVRTVQRCLRSLQDANIIAPLRKTHRGRGKTTIYKLDLSKAQKKEKFPGQFKQYDDLDEIESHNGDNLAPFLENQKNDNLSPFMAQEKGDNLASLSEAKDDKLTPNPDSKRVSICPEKGDKFAEKGDKLSCAYKEEKHVLETCTRNMEIPMSSSWNSTDALPVSVCSEKNLPDSSAESEPKRGVQIREVFEHWKTALNHPKAKLDAKRKKAILARLVDGYTVTELKIAIDGCRASAFHQGNNDRGRVYDDLDLICRDAKHVEQFIAIIEIPASTNGHSLQNGVIPYEPNRPRETHNARAARKTFERIEALRLAAGGFDCPDPDGAETPWTPVD